MRKRRAAAGASSRSAPATTTRLAPTRWVPGSVVSRDDAKHRDAEAGRLEFVAEVGTRLKVGERIAKLDDQTLRLRREEIQSDVRRAEAQRALSETQLQRLDKARDSPTASPRRSSTRRARRWKPTRRMLAHARAQLHQIEHDIEQADVHAPFAGIVTERFAQRGEYLQIGAMVVHLVDTDHIEARVQAPLALADKIRAGMRSQGANPLAVENRERARGRSGRRRTLAPVRTARRSGRAQLALVGSAVEVALPEDDGGETSPCRATRWCCAKRRPT